MTSNYANTQKDAPSLVETMTLGWRGRCQMKSGAIIRVWRLTALVTRHCCWIVSAIASELPPNDYPTVGRADYVFACMQANGQTREILEKCSCSVDQIAAFLPWAEYDEAETIMSVGMRGGDSQSLFNSPQLQMKVHTLKLAQVEAELRCF